MKKLLAILFILSIVLTNKAHERLEPDNCVYFICGNMGNPVTIKLVCYDD